MAIVELNKVTFCGMSRDKRAVLERLQAMGGLHLIANPAVGERQESASHELAYAEPVGQALKYLHGCARKRQQIRSDPDFDLERIANDVLSIKERIREVGDRYDAISQRIEEIEPWGDFRLPGQADMAGQRLWFYIVPQGRMATLQDNGLVWQTVFKNNLFCYVVVISPDEPPAHSMPVARTHVGAISLSDLYRERGKLALQLEDLQAERESMTRWITLMTLHFNEALDKADLNQALRLTRDDLGVFAVQGWLPAYETTRYQAFAEQQSLAMLIEPPHPAENPPTLLNNPPKVAGGQDLVAFYQMPNYRSWDPSAIVFFSFVVFFALILSDAGYAMVFLIALLVKWRRLGGSERGRRLRVLAANTLGASIAWGVLIGSYFGYTPPDTSAWAALKHMDLNDFDTMMRLSITIGVSHLLIANLIRARLCPSWTAALAPTGWLALLLGGYFLWLASTGFYTPLQPLGTAAMAVGFGLVLLFTGQQPVRSFKTLMGRLLDGLKGLIGITQMFGDVLSYMRLFALGLASASLALTFNHLAVDVYHALRGPGLFFSILILLLGHALNLVLCLMSGVVHGLRLNFIEFYNWSVSDEGYPFKAFSKRGVHP